MNSSENSSHNRAKRHHFIPRFILKNFSNNEDKIAFWRSDFNTSKAKFTDAINLFVQKELYTFRDIDQTKNVELEEYFANLESTSADFLGQLVAVLDAGNYPSLDAVAWEFWHQFMYFSMKRTPKHMEGVFEEINLSDLMKEPFRRFSERVSKLGGDVSIGLADAEQQAKVFAYGAPPNSEIHALLSELGMVIYKANNSRKSLIVGDSVIALARVGPENSTELNGIATFLPFTPKYAFGFIKQANRIVVINVDDETVRRMNEAMTASSNMIAGNSKKLIESLARVAPGLEPIVPPRLG